jgi:hypothetical protein
MTDSDFIIELFCRVDDEMKAVKNIARLRCIRVN